MKDLFKTKTAWTGLIAIAAGLVAAAFGPDDQFVGVGKWLSAASHDNAVVTGLLAIFLRHGIQKQ